MHPRSLRKIAFSAAVLLIVVGLSPFEGWGQNASSRETYIYTAEDVTVPKARSEALDGLARQIQVFVSTAFRQERTKGKHGYTDSMVISTIAQSSATLSDVDEQVRPLPDGRFRVTLSVSKASVVDMFDRRKSRIIELLDLAHTELGNAKVHKSVNMDLVLKNAYWAYLLASIHPYRVDYSFTDESGRSRSSTDVVEGIRYFIESISERIRTWPIKRIEDDVIVWRCRFEYDGISVSSLGYSFYDGVGQTDGRVKNGESILTFFFPTVDNREREIDLQLEFRSEEEMDELLRLAEGSASKFPKQTILLNLAGSKEPPPAILILPAVLQELIAKNTSLSSVLEALNKLVRGHRAIIGRKDEFVSLNGVYGLVFGESGIVAIIQEEQGKSTDVLNSRPADMNLLAGKKITWIEPLERKTK